MFSFDLDFGGLDGSIFVICLRLGFGAGGAGQNDDSSAPGGRNTLHRAGQRDGAYCIDEFRDLRIGQPACGGGQTIFARARENLHSQALTDQFGHSLTMRTTS